MVDLLSAEQIYQGLLPKYDYLKAQIQEGKLKRDGNVINPFPKIEGLELSAENFLQRTYAVIQGLARLYSVFFSAKISNPRFDKVLKELKSLHPDQTRIIDLVTAQLPTIEHLVLLRNGLEHPTPLLKTVISDFKLEVDGISPPQWGLSTGSMTSMIQEMPQIIDFLTCFSEVFSLTCLVGHVKEPFPYSINVLPEAEIDPQFPIKYLLEIDFHSITSGVSKKPT
jgi:hypothetical protein